MEIYMDTNNETTVKKTKQKAEKPLPTTSETIAEVEGQLPASTKKIIKGAKQSAASSKKAAKGEKQSPTPPKKGTKGAKQAPASPETVNDDKPLPTPPETIAAEKPSSDHGPVPFLKPEGEDCKSITVTAETEKLGAVLGFVDEILESVECPIRTQMQIDVAVEELFVNIARYAYKMRKGKADISVWYDKDTGTICIEFRDKGVPFDPQLRQDPDISLSAEKRAIGGLGIFMVKKSMDGMHYRREGDRNILTIWKKIKETIKNGHN